MIVNEDAKIVQKTDNSGLTISEMSERAFQNSANHGFHDEPVAFSTRLMLIVSELAEAMEEERSGRPLNETYFSGNGKPEGVPAELADVIIRVGDLAHIYGIDLAAAVEQKMKYNESRPHKHGKAF